MDPRRLPARPHVPVRRSGRRVAATARQSPAPRVARSTNSSARRAHSSSACETPISTGRARIRAAFGSSTAPVRSKRSAPSWVFAWASLRARANADDRARCRRDGAAPALVAAAALAALLGDRCHKGPGGLASGAPAARTARHRQARPRAQSRAGAALRNSTPRRPRMRRLPGLPVRDRRPASGSAAARALQRSTKRAAN